MSGARLAACVVAWLACLVPLALPLELAPGTTRLAVCMLIWTAVLSLPLRAAPAAGASAAWRSVLACLGLALPQLGLALGLDVIATDDMRDVFGGSGSAGPLVAFGLAFLLLILLTLAAEIGARRTRPLYAWAWAALVLGPSMLSFALRTSGPAPELVSRLSAASPLAWFLERSGAQPAPFLIAIVVLVVACAAPTERANVTA